MSRVVRLCNENSLPLTVRGAGTNLSGGTIPSPKGAVVLTNALNEITLKLIPPPASQRAMFAVFDQIDKASETVAAIIANRIVPATLEFLDNFTIRVAKDAAERDKVWEARRSALSALAKLKPTVVIEDATVPRSKIPDMVRAIQNISQRFDILIGTFGHAGDGNLHPTILTDRRDKAEWQRVESAIDAIFDKALALGGTLSGEHGIGTAKSRFLEQETSKATIVYSRRIKAALDPNNILNPGKIIGQ